MKKFMKKLIPSRLKKKIKEKRLEIIKNELRNTECKYVLNIEDNKKLSKKVAIVTGGSGAIGSAICFKLAMQGAIVYVCGRNSENIEKVINQIESNNGIAKKCILDVKNDKNISTAFKEIFKVENRIDILINNAGGSARNECKELCNQDVKVIDNIIDTNLRGTILCCKEVARYMKGKKYGKIINIGSTTGVQGNANNSEYSAAKSALIGFTKSLAMELGKYNVNVNLVSPGRIRQILFDEIIEEIPDKGCYLNRIGKTSDVANLISFLVSEDSNYITGQNIIIDGGRTLGLKEG